MKIHLSLLNEGFICDEITIKMPRWIDEVRKVGHTIFFESCKLRPISHNRNSIVKRFLESDADFLIQIDNDTVPSKNPLLLIDTMLEKKIDILSCPVWIYQHKLMLNIYKYDEKQEYLIPVDFEKNKNAKLIEIDATGTGLLVCSRKVLKDIKKPFERIYDEDGIAILGQDLAFSQKAKEKGFKIFSHLDYICKHYKSIDLSVFK